MANDWYKMYVAILIVGASIQTIFAENQPEERSNDENVEPRALFHPRVDYNEWMPVGRGDPLKNDPTYDYSPPVLDRVHYWGNFNKSKDKKDILLLGVTSKRSHKKEPKHNTIMRRNFHSHLPTRLMPPPMQTISAGMKHMPTENYHGSYYRNHYSMPSHSWSHNSIKYGDSNVDESISYHSVSRPNKNTIRNEYPPQYTSSSRKPWIHALLEKEVTKPTPLYLMQPSKSIFESHPPPSYESIQTIPSNKFSTTKSYILTTSESPYFHPTIQPVSSTTTTTTEAALPYKDLPQNLGPRPMYLIIEGHSKVKTYGQKDNATGFEHAPKIVPIQPDEEAIIKHVVSEDDNGHAMEVMHLHKTHQPSTAPTTTSAPPTGMGGLLSLLDASFGSFFLGDDQSVKAENVEPSKKPKFNKDEKINKMENPKPVEITEKPENVEDSTIPTNLENIEISDRMDRETRQIFDYDDLPQPSFREDDDRDLMITLLPKNSQGSMYDDYSSPDIL